MATKEKLTKGELTHNRILSTAKKLFYEQGYEATTIQQIADCANSTLGSMTYHFPTKSKFVDIIMDDYFSNITKAVRLYQTQPINSFEEHFRLTMIYYNNLLSDPNNAFFYYEIHKNTALYEFLHQRIFSIYSNFVTDYNLNLRPLELDAIIQADFGARRSCIMGYYNGKIKMSIEDFAIFLLGYTSKSLGIPEEEISKVGHQSLLFYKEHDFSHIKFLL